MGDHGQKHAYDPNTTSTKNKSQYGKDVDIEKITLDTMYNPDHAVTKLYPDGSRVTIYKKEYNGNISTPDTPTGSHRVFDHLTDPRKSTNFPFVPRN